MRLSNFDKNYSTFLVLQRRFLGKICDDREKFNLDESAHSMLRRGFSLKTKHFGFCQAISSSFSGRFGVRTLESSDLQVYAVRNFQRNPS